MEKTEKAIIGALIVLVLVLLWAMTVQGNQNKEANALLHKITQKAESEKQAKEVAEAPKKRLSSYEAKRVENIEHKNLLQDEINSYQETVRLTDDNISTLEKQIRCQRAFLISKEEGNCEDAEVYEAYAPVPY